MNTYEYEYTDTFGGEANYCWVNRGKIRAKSELGAMRIAKRILGLSGTKGKREDWGDTIAFYPHGMCTVLFVNWCEE